MAADQSMEGTPLAEKPVVKQKKGISPIWILPIVAVLIGAWLLYKGIADAPIKVVITFETAGGITAGKTKVLFKGLQAGLVKSIRIDPDHKAVDVLVDFDRGAKNLLVSGTKFWLVKPRVSLKGVAGLSTLLKGDYIAMRPGDEGGKAARKFEALAEPPPIPEDAPGLHLILVSEELVSFERGLPVYYNKIPIGDVQGYKLAENPQQVEISIFIQPEYSHLVNKDTRFWNVSGIDVEGSLSGFKIHTPSLTSLLLGGIECVTPKAVGGGHPAENGDRFKLFKGYQSAEEAIHITILFPSAEGLRKGQTEVKFKGFTAGHVTKLHLMNDLSVKAEITMNPRAERLLLSDTKFWLVKPKLSLKGMANVETLIKGQYIEMGIGGKGKPQRDFVALDEPPLVREAKPGLRVKVVARDLGSLDAGSPVFYKKMPVGIVESQKFNSKTDKIEFQVFINKDFQHLVRKNSRFWDASGIDVTASLSGVEIRTESLQSVLSGGIAFYTPKDETKAKTAKDGDIYTLFEDYKHAHVTGVPIKITFENAEGLNKGTKLKYRDVTVGQVDSVSFDKTLSKIVVTVHVDRNARTLAAEGSRFWVVKPKIGLSGASHLGTLITGDYIAVMPAEKKGRPKYEFVGLSGPPFEKPGVPGLRIILTADKLGSVGKGNRVYYREIPVGQVSGYELAETADHVRIHVDIQPRFAPLVRVNSVFWNASGIDIHAGLFSGVEMHTESLKSILEGGIAFATPENDRMGEQAGQNAVFTLHLKVNDHWLKWRPRIRLGQ